MLSKDRCLEQKLTPFQKKKIAKVNSFFADHIYTYLTHIVLILQIINARVTKLVNFHSNINLESKTTINEFYFYSSYFPEKLRVDNF